LQRQNIWAARYGSVADAFTEAIDMLEALISNSVLDRQRPPNTGGEVSKAQQGGKVGV